MKTLVGRLKELVGKVESARAVARLVLVRTLLLFFIQVASFVMAQAAAGDGNGAHGDPSQPAEAGEEPSAVESSLELRLEAALAQSSGSGNHLGTRFGLGLFYFSDHQTSLQNTFSRSAVTLEDPAHGTSSTTILQGDPELNNRKFDFELDLQGAGVYFPVKLPSIGGSKAHSITLGLEVAETDVSFDVLDTTAGSTLSSSFSGSGPLYGAGIDATFCVTPNCRSLWSTRYRYRDLPRLDVDRSIPIGAPCIEVLADEVSISRKAHEVSTRIGYSLGTSRRFYAPYTGVLYRQVEVEIEDHIRFLDGFGIETAQETVSRYDSDSVLGVAGFDAQLSDSISGSFESFFGDGDYGVRFQVAWSKKAGIPGKWRTKIPDRRAQRVRRWIDKREGRLDKIYPQIELEIERARAGFGWPTDEREAEARIKNAADALVEALSRPGERRRNRDLAPLRDYVTYHSERLLVELRAGPPATTAGPGRQTTSVAVLAALSSQGDVLPALGEGDEDEPGWLERWGQKFRDVVFGLETAVERTECRYAEFVFSAPPVALFDPNGNQIGLDKGTVLDLVVYTAPDVTLRKDIPQDVTFPEFPRALYGFRVRPKDGDALECQDPGRAGGCPLDLLLIPCSKFWCTLDKKVCLQPGEIRVPSGCNTGPRTKCDPPPEP